MLLRSLGADHDQPQAAGPSPSFIQAKLTVGAVNDPLEDEADRAADQVMRMPDAEPPRLGRKSTTGNDQLQPKPSGAPSNDRPDAMGEVQAALRSPGQAIDPATRAFFDQGFGHDFGHVRIHAGPGAAASTRAVNALAYTVGADVVFAPGQFAPGTAVGKQLLAHELAHVVQQSHAGARANGAQLRRAPADALVTKLEAKLNAVPPNLAGFYGDIAALNASRAGDAALRTGIESFVTGGKLSSAQAFRAVALQEIGPDRTWPLPVKNFAEGLDSGTFTIAGLAPAGADALRAFAVEQAGTAAEGSADKLAAYVHKFDSLWDGTAYAAFATTFDDSLDSRGPRNQRARHIFQDLYADLLTHIGYDDDQPAGFRALVDTHEAPDGIDNIASQRLQKLRALLAPPQVVAADTADVAYTGLVATVTPAAQALDARDHQEIERSHTWRLAVDAKVTGGTPAATQGLHDDLWSVITSARQAAPPPLPPGPLPPGPVPVAPVSEPVPVPNAAQKAWLDNVAIAPPASPQNATTADFPLPFQVRSTKPNPGLGVRRRVVLEPAAQVISGQQDEQAWPNAASQLDHTPHVNPDAGAAGSTAFTAKLTMPPLPVAKFPEQTTNVTVNDKRQDWFKNTIDPGITFVNENTNTWLWAGASLNYFGGQFPISIRPRLGPPGGAQPNPNLTIFMDGTIKRGGAVINAMPRAQFGASATDSPLFNTILREPAPPPAPAGDPMEVTVNYFAGAAPGPAIKTQTVAFTLGASLPVGAGADAALIAADNAALNQPVATPGSLLNFMSTAGAVGSSERAVGAAVAAGTIKVAATIVRSDSSAKVTAAGGNPTTQVAYAMGKVDGAGAFAATLIAQPGAIGWRWGGIADTVFLNLTPNSHAPANKRANADMAGLLTHEGIHAADKVGGGDFERYATEFRAYWIMGIGAGLSEAPDSSMSNLGPKSPRANAIFHHVYGSETYPFAQKAYDGNVDHFRERVDNMLHPDGINLTLSRPLMDLRAEVESYVSSDLANYNVKKAAVVAKYAACSADDKKQITDNRAWRDLIESKFTTMLSVTPPPALLSERWEIKNVLAIPQ